MVEQSVRIDRLLHHYPTHNSTPLVDAESHRFHYCVVNGGTSAQDEQPLVKYLENARSSKNYVDDSVIVLPSVWCDLLLVDCPKSRCY